MRNEMRNDRFRGALMDVSELVRHSVLRRCWFLSKAAECGDFGRALEMARAAEEFVIGADETQIEAIPVACAESKVAPTPEKAVAAPPPAPVPAAPPAKAEPERKPGRLALSDDRRDELLDRLAQGARNRELADLFGVSPQQIQGVRMGAAREIAERRSRVRPAEADADSEIEATVDDVVRYLRQQDDVVVRQEDGTFLVNGRFRLGASELIAKANRMLERQHKPVFKALGPDCRLSHATATLGTNGHRHA